MKWEKNYIVFCMLLAGVSSSAQSYYYPFTGSITVGSGISTTIDFNEAKNGNILCYQLGLTSIKKLNRQVSFETGIVFSHRGSSYNYTEKNPGSLITYGYNINIYSIDIPIAIYRNNNSKIKPESFFYFAFRPSIIPFKPKIFTNYSVSINDNYFRDYNLIGSLGYGFKFTSLIITKFTINSSLLSIIKKDYKEDFVTIVDYFGPNIYFAEILISMNYILK
ncbi:MAG: hypothetical protein P1P82_14385 [Bacteroidales bacterium]|nr:hypothetical protein [Bacteroidales bacterium]